MENDPLVDKQLGAYLIQAKLGEGGMARVYKAYHARLRREVAIKVILPQVADKEGFRERFEREAQLVASLEYRNIVAVYDFGELGNLTYLVMQYVGGGTLRDKLREQGRIEPRRAAQYAIQMARALHHAHVHGIVHRDVKPQNMLISASDPNEILLSDFGIAKLYDVTKEETLSSTGGGVGSDPSLTSVDQLVGTAEYMAPEQINRQPVDARTDVYALGIVLFQMLTGEIPFSSTTVQGLLFQHVYTPPKPVRQVNPNVPEALEEIISRALAKAPEQRFQTAEAMAQALEALPGSSTNQLSNPASGNYATPGRTSGQAFPSSGQNFPQPIASAPSYYGQAYPPDAASYGQQSAYGIVSPGQSALSETKITGGGSIVAPPRPRAPGMFRTSTIVSTLVIVLAVVAVTLGSSGRLAWMQHLFGSGTQPSSSSFTETFTDNGRNWTIGSQDGGNLTASITNKQYMLSVGSNANTYFPNPSSAGTLPENFTLTAQIMENQGGQTILYGLAFHFKEDSNGVSCYAFVIDGNGDYQILKYAANKLQHIWNATSQAIHAGQSNTLQVTVQGSKFSFKINGNAVPSGANQAMTMTDTTYSGGNLALLVAGPNASFTVTSVTLASL